ncbi:MAG: hypothetical protein KAX18_05800 [Candidatus Lokiarchaeota archaeon]|nr:hypothetical protein [Candidatus Lokiarchaeota archaeon]
MNRTRCPYCKTGLVIIDNKIDFCPLCELAKMEKISESLKNYHIPQAIF